MQMFKRNRMYILLGFLSFLLVAEAFNFDKFDFWNRDEPDEQDEASSEDEPQQQIAQATAENAQPEQSQVLPEDERLQGSDASLQENLETPEEASQPNPVLLQGPFDFLFGDDDTEDDEDDSDDAQQQEAFQEPPEGFFPPQEAFFPVQETPDEFFPPQEAFFPVQQDQEIELLPIPSNEQETQPEPITTTPRAITDPVTPVKVETVAVVNQVEQDFHVGVEVPFGMKKIKFMSTTETVTFTATSYFRSTVIVTPTLYKTDTLIVQANAAVTRDVVSESETTVTETRVLVRTETTPQRLFNTIRTPVNMYLTVEDQTTKTVLEPYYITTTSKKIHTVWETITVNLSNENSIRIPVVELITETTTIPYHLTITDWFTRTETETLCREW